MGQSTRIVTLREWLVGDTRTPLIILLGAAVFVLLVACTNVASTLLARGTVRSREMAVRSALGGTRGRLVRQLITENLVLSLVGSTIGVVFAALGLMALRALGVQSIPRLDYVGLDSRVLEFTFAVAVATSLLFGLLPALKGSDGRQAQALRDEQRGNAPSRSMTWDALVAAEVALALVLLIGSGLLVRSFVAVLDQDTGFDPDDVAMTSLALSAQNYPDLDSSVHFWDALLARVNQIPGVAAAGLMSSPPLSWLPNGRIALDGDPGKTGRGGYVVVSSGAFEALDMRLVRGRLFDERDGPDAPQVVVVNESFAVATWPGTDPLGHRVTGGGMDNLWDPDTPVFAEVVGVVADVRQRNLERPPEPTVYWNYRQRPFRIALGATVLAESATGDPATVAQPLRTAIRMQDSDIPVRVRYMTDVVSASLGQRRFMLFVLASFAALALVLAAVGIYGVVSYAVARRTREMGVRLALGAQPGSVRRLVLLGAIRPLLAGTVLGIAGALALSRALQGLLYQVGPTDPVTFLVVAGGLLATGMAASWIPAQRGTTVDPMVAMRVE